MRVLAISGSLRAASINSALLRAAMRLARPEMEIRIFGGMAELPLFNPDLEVQVPRPAAALREAVSDADALLIASPEYAHGITGVIKNALDWLVSCEDFAGKHVAVLNASGRAQHADAALRETLKTMAADIVEDASLTIPISGTTFPEEAMLHCAPIADALRRSLEALYEAVSVPTPAVELAGPLE
jgi:NAD(P)H-dependent FMN reductase